MSRRSLIALLWGGILLSSCADDHPVAPDPSSRAAPAARKPDRPGQVPGEYIVVLKEGAPSARILGNQLTASHGLQIRHTYEHAIHGFSAVIPEAALTGLSHHPWIESIEPNRIAYLEFAMPPDPVPTVGLRIRLVADDLAATHAEGATVASWSNLGTAGAAGQATASKRPAFHTGAAGPFAGHAHVGFNEGSDNDELLEIAGIAAHGSATLIAVFKQDDAGAHNYGIFGLYSSSTNRGGFVTRHNKSGADPISFWDRTNGWKDSNYTVAAGTPLIAVWRIDAGVAADYQVNGTARGSAAMAGPIHQPFSRYLIGMTEPNTTARFDGQIAEILLYERALTNCERDDIVAKLGARYGISVAVAGGACEPPAVPTSLTAAAIDVDAIDLTWVDNATNEAGYRIERRQGQAGSFGEVATAGEGATAYSDQPLSPATEYCYRVAAFNNVGDSPYSQIACATTDALPPPPPPDPVPTAGLRLRLVADELGATLTDGATVASWSNLGSDADAVQGTVSRQPTFHAGAGGLFGTHAHVGFNESTDNDEVLTVAGVAAHGSATLIAVFSQDDANAHNYGIVGLYASSTNRAGFVTRHEGGADPISYWDPTHGWKDGTFTATAGAPHVAVWRIKASVAADYQVDGTARGSSTMAGPIHQPFDRYLVGMTEPSTTSRFDGQIAEILLYDRALSDCERDNVVADLGARYGIPITVPGGGLCVPPGAPSGLTASTFDHARIDLSWSDNAGNESGFRIERREGQGGTFVEIATVGPNVTTYSDDAPPLVPGTEYCYRVVAFNGDGASGYSNIDCATTPAAPPGVCANTGNHDDLSQLWNISKVKADRNATWVATQQPGCGITPWFFGLDSGVDSDHPDLNVVEIANFVSAEPAETGEDGNGHGTHTAGTAAAKDGNGSVVGVAPGASVYGFRVCRDDGSCEYADIIAGVDEVTARKLANPGQPMVANLSLGGEISDAMDIAIRSAINAGVVVAVAAGNGIEGACFFPNDAQNVSPARTGDDAINAANGSDGNTLRTNGVLTTTSSNANDQSVNCNYGNPVTIAAPGVNVKSTWLAGGYNTISGTSMATPHAAGAALLYLQAHPSATPVQVEQAIRDLLDSWTGSPQPNADGRLDVEDL